MHLEYRAPGSCTRRSLIFILCRKLLDLLRCCLHASACMDSCPIWSLAARVKSAFASRWEHNGAPSNWMVLREALVLALFGIAIGIPSALIATRCIASGHALRDFHKRSAYDHRRCPPPPLGCVAGGISTSSACFCDRSGGCSTNGMRKAAWTIKSRELTQVSE